ncbi:helix-turn-helix domain-containing protein [Arsenophonus nasoniae]|uniref:helix-turn-helix domain-containing protein n=1 Tax=Arsenophonus nasoniae TaxID=638 RepID=UPI003879BC02
MTLSRDYADKLKAIRKAEGMTQKQFSIITGLSLGTVKNYETKQHDAKALTVEKVLEVEQFQKYTVWLMTDKTVPAAGQIAPALTHCGTDGEEAQKQTRKTGEDSDVRSSHYDQKTG